MKPYSGIPLPLAIVGFVGMFIVGWIVPVFTASHPQCYVTGDGERQICFKALEMCQAAQAAETAGVSESCKFRKGY